MPGKRFPSDCSQHTIALKGDVSRASGLRAGCDECQAGPRCPGNRPGWGLSQAQATHTHCALWGSLPCGGAYPGGHVHMSGSGPCGPSALDREAPRLPQGREHRRGWGHRGLRGRPRTHHSAWVSRQVMTLSAQSPSPDPEPPLLRDMPPCQEAVTGLEGPRPLGPGRRDQRAGCSLNPAPASAPITPCVRPPDSLSAWTRLATRCLGLLVVCADGVPWEPWL